MPPTPKAQGLTAEMQYSSQRRSIIRGRRRSARLATARGRGREPGAWGGPDVGPPAHGVLGGTRVLPLPPWTRRFAPAGGTVTRGHGSCPALASLLTHYRLKKERTKPIAPAFIMAIAHPPRTYTVFYFELVT